MGNATTKKKTPDNIFGVMRPWEFVANTERVFAWSALQIQEQEFTAKKNARYRKKVKFNEKGGGRSNTP